MSTTNRPAGRDEAAAAPPPVPEDFAWRSLHGRLAAFSHGGDRAAVMRPDVGIFGALADQTDPAAWRELAELTGPDRTIGVFPLTVDLPTGWTETFRLAGVQMVGDAVAGDRRADVVDLGAIDIDDVMDLVERTRPGPFARRTIELGGYLGLRQDDRLIAIAGQRLATDEDLEISAVCVDPDHRRQGLARVVVDAVVAAIRTDGRRPILHAAADNTNAIALYEAMGFTISRRFDFVGVQAS